jgi:hypothetical protein
MRAGAHLKLLKRFVGRQRNLAIELIASLVA